MADASGRLADSDGKQINATNQGGFYTEFGGGGNVGGVADTQHDGHDRQGRNETEQGGNRENNRLFIGGGGELCSSGRMADAARRQCQQFGGAQGHDVQRPADCGRLVQPNSRGWQKGRVAAETARHGSSAESAGRLGFWSDFDLIPCRDGKVRRVPLEPALFPLAHGIPDRVGLLRGAGNAIVPQVAAEFVMAWAETQNASLSGSDAAGDRSAAGDSCVPLAKEDGNA